MLFNQDESEVLETQTTESTPEEVVEEATEEYREPVAQATEDSEVDDVDALRREKEELERKNKQLYERLKKEQSKPAPAEGSLSAKDFLALRDANISADDFDEVQEFASWKKVSIAEALANPTLKAILRDRTEERRTAQATETKSPRGIARSSGEDLLLKAEKTGEVPTTDEGIAALIKARMERKRRN